MKNSAYWCPYGRAGGGYWARVVAFKIMFFWAYASIVASQDQLPGANGGGLVLVGGGEVPAKARQRFLDLAGGPDAEVIVVPTASQLADTEPPETWLGPWREWKASRVQLLHTRDQAVADTPEFADQIRRASGVWFSGGDQSRLMEAYGGTLAQREFERVRQRGGVVGGTSAGAAIASRVMIAGGDDQPEISQGFDLLPRTIVDQHFSQRHRLPRLCQAVRFHPDLVGLGIDENTAVIFATDRVEVVGSGYAFVIRAKNNDRVDPRQQHPVRVEVQVFGPGAESTIPWPR